MCSRTSGRNKQVWEAGGGVTEGVMEKVTSSAKGAELRGAAQGRMKTWAFLAVGAPYPKLGAGNQCQGRAVL